MNIIEHLEHGIPMARQGFVGICRKKRVGSREIRMCTMRQPTNGPNNALVFPLAFKQGRIFVFFVRFWYCINCEAGTVRCDVRCDVPFVNAILFNNMSDKTSLTQVDG